MAAGTPVLALRATGTEDIVRNGVNGYMINVSGDSAQKISHDEQVFAGRLMDILSGKELEFLKQGAIETAASYDCQRIALKAAACYRRAIWTHGTQRTRFYRQPAGTG